MKSCFFFPDTGNQFPGMGKDFFDTSSIIREIFGLASDIFSTDMKKLMFESTPADICSTIPAILTTAVMERASAASAREHGIYPLGTTGYGLGILAALTEAKALSESEFFTLIYLIANLTTSAKNFPKNLYTSVSIIVDAKKPELFWEEANSVFLAAKPGYNHLILTGRDEAIIQTCKFFESSGATIVKRSASFPLFTPLASYLSDGLKEYLADFQPKPTIVPVFLTNTTPPPHDSVQIKDFLLTWATSPVMWSDSMQQVFSHEFEMILETGPGGSLATMFRGAFAQPMVSPGSTLDQIVSISL